MSWEFETDPDFEEQLDWMRTFVRDECEPLDLLWPEYHLAPPPDWLRPLTDGLKAQVRERGLWACHLSPDLGGQGYGQLKLALMNEILGTSEWSQTIFGVNAPDTGNAEILAHYGTHAQKQRYLEPLLNGECFSAFSMTEPQGGADPAQLRTRAVRDGDEWVIDGDKYFTSNARDAAFLIVMAVTDPDVEVYRGTSMFLVPRETPGFEIVRDTALFGEEPGVGMTHPHVAYRNVRVGADALLGVEGEGFKIAQTRLGGGRIHHAMRAIGVAQRAFELMCERAASRETQGTRLADKQLVQAAIADSYVEIEPFRLFVLRTAWGMDRHGSRAMRRDISATKVLAARVLRDVVERSLHLHGALGTSEEMPLARMWRDVASMGIHDGPTEVHLGVIARQLMFDVAPAEGIWPSAWVPALRERAHEKYADVLARRTAEEVAGAR
jgi:acyl-CoA dehydrogenase